MHEVFLFQALALLDRLCDDDCGEFEHYEIDLEIEKLKRFMRPADRGYYEAFIDIVTLANTN